MYFLLQLVMHFLPFIKSLINALWFPFRFLHVYLHVYSAKELVQILDQKKNEEEDDYDDIHDQYILRSSFATGLSRNDENSMLITSFNRIGYAQKVAMAPNRFGWVLLIGYLVISPLALVTPLTQVLTTVAGAAIHFYFFMGIFGVMMPTLNDWLFILNTIILNLNIRPIYIFNAVIVLIVFTLDTFWRTTDFFIAILVGTVAFILYLWGLFAIALFALRGKIQRSDIFFIPYPKKKGAPVSTIDIEFHDLEDEYEWDE
ncbi:MAG: hypothetical protein ACFFB2_19585 [Promethearchaeota archaeon]